jgi:hypothetical protein
MRTLFGLANLRTSRRRTGTAGLPKAGAATRLRRSRAPSPRRSRLAAAEPGAAARLRLRCRGLGRRSRRGSGIRESGSRNRRVGKGRDRSNSRRRVRLSNRDLRSSSGRQALVLARDRSEARSQAEINSEKISRRKIAAASNSSDNLVHHKPRVHRKSRELRAEHLELTTGKINLKAIGGADVAAEEVAAEARLEAALVAVAETHHANLKIWFTSHSYDF